jgi:hypothetical protein
MPYEAPTIDDLGSASALIQHQAGGSADGGSTGRSKASPLTELEEE